MDEAPDRWARVQHVFESALDRPAPERSAFVRDRCGADADVHGEVLSLLSAHAHANADGCVETPAIQKVNPPTSFGSTEHALQPGHRLGPYEIVAWLDAGGMGEVYRARDPQVGRDVAIKIVSAQFSSDPDRLRRFEQEVRAAGSLNHPNLLTIYFADVQAGCPYLVSELLDGETLRIRLKGGRLPARQCAAYAADIASGLAAAHDRGITHRDLKPENIFVTTDDRVKILDFGLAKLRDVGAELDATQDFRTHTGVVLGTAGYMSPEQVRAQPADHRSDIFALGAVMYELVTARRAFHGASLVETMGAVLNQEPPEIASVQPDCPPALERIIRRCLEKSPANRFQSAHDLRFALDTLSAAPGKAARGSGLEVRRSRRPKASRIRSLAVLPLQNLSRDPDQEFFSDGTTEALISNLAQIHELDVISRTSVMRYKGTTKTAPQIGRELGVDAIVEGSVQRVGGRVRITAQLIRASTDKHLWAREYERDAADVLKLEAEIARTIAQEIQAHLTPEETRRLATARSISPDAREAFLLGRYHQFKDNEADLRQAIEHFQRAIRLQPDYAAAYAGLSLTSRLLQTRGFTKEEGAARTAALKAIELDPNLGEAHAAMSGLKFDDWDWTGAETEARRALELNYVDQYYASLLTITGRHAQAIAAAEHAAKVDPLSSGIQSSYGLVLYFARKFEDALSQQKRSIDLEPRNYAAAVGLGMAYIALEKPQEALALFDRPDFRDGPYIAHTYARLGRRDDALRVLHAVVTRGGAFDFQEMALAYFALGDKERGFDWLTKAFDQRAGYVPWAKVQPAFDGLRSDPRFQKLVARLKLPPD